MSILKFKGHSKASGKNVGYITRETACDSVSFHNLKELETGDRYDNKVNALSYAYNREEEETQRTHYRVTLSWEGKEETEKAKEMTHEFLQKEFPNARAVVAVHQDTDQTHSHVWIEARQLDDKKIHSPKNHINQICKSWQTQYDREYQTERAKEYEQKREESRQHREDKHNGRESVAPDRAGMRAQDYRNKDLRDAGVKENEFEQSATGGNQRPFAVRDSAVKEADRAVTGSQQQIEESKRNSDESKQRFERAIESLDRAQSSVRQLRDEADRMVEIEKRQQIEKDRENERGYER